MTAPSMRIRCEPGTDVVVEFGGDGDIRVGVWTSQSSRRWLHFSTTLFGVGMTVTNEPMIPVALEQEQAHAAQNA